MNALQDVLRSHICRSQSHIHFLAASSQDTKFIAQYVDGRPAAQITSQRYKALGRQPLFRLLQFAFKEFPPLNNKFSLICAIAWH